MKVLKDFEIRVYTRPEFSIFYNLKGTQHKIDKSAEKLKDLSEFLNADGFKIAFFRGRSVDLFIDGAYYSFISTSQFSDIEMDMIIDILVPYLYDRTPMFNPF